MSVAHSFCFPAAFVLMTWLYVALRKADTDTETKTETENRNRNRHSDKFQLCIRTFVVFFSSSPCVQSGHEKQKQRQKTETETDTSDDLRVAQNGHVHSRRLVHLPPSTHHGRGAICELSRVRLPIVSVFTFRIVFRLGSDVHTRPSSSHRDAVRHRGRAGRAAAAPSRDRLIGFQDRYRNLSNPKNARRIGRESPSHANKHRHKR